MKKAITVLLIISLMFVFASCAYMPGNDKAGANADGDNIITEAFEDGDITENNTTNDDPETTIPYVIRDFFSGDNTSNYSTENNRYFNSDDVNDVKKMIIDWMKKGDIYNDEHGNKTWADRISSVKDVTPKAIAEETSDIKILAITGGMYATTGSAIVVNDNVVSFSPYSRYNKVYLYDYNEDGIKDLVYIKDVGSGISIIVMNILDLKTGQVYLVGRDAWEPFSFYGVSDGNLYYMGDLITFENGKIFRAGVEVTQ